ncbi:MAG: TetR family transcriptional regulator C-terminal domain-containing protein, partial [Raineya sp.]
KKMWEQKAQFASFKENFKAYAQELLNEALETGEAQNRNFLNNAYPDFLWANTLYLLNFWLKDTSKNFEQTDASVEKIVNLFFDIVGKTFLDSLFDFAKFAFQNR